MTYFLIGSPLSGKTTISTEIIKLFKFEYFSTGEFARNNGMKPNRDIGEFDLDLSLDEKIRQTVINIATKYEATYLIDGFPRSTDQILDLIDNGIDFKIIFMYVNPVTMYQRARGRDRSDDDIDIVAQRSRASHRLFKNLKSILGGGEILFYDGDIDNINKIKGFICE